MDRLPNKPQEPASAAAALAAQRHRRWPDEGRAMNRLVRWRGRMSRSWRPWSFVALTLACLWMCLSTTGVLAAIGGVGCLLSLLCLWLIVTVRPDDTLDDGLAEAALGAGFGTGDD